MRAFSFGGQVSGLVKITHRSLVPGNECENEMRRSCGKETEEEREGKGTEEEVKKRLRPLTGFFYVNFRYYG